MAIHPCTSENVWFSQQKYEADEAAYQCTLSGAKGRSNPTTSSTLVSEIAEARQHIHKALSSSVDTAPTTTQTGTNAQLLKRIDCLEKVTDDLKALVLKLDNRLAALEKTASTSSKGPATCSQKEEEAAKEDEEDDDDFDPFADDDDEEEVQKLKEKKQQEVAGKKKKEVIAKSSVVFDVKPWSDETDLKAMEKCVREIKMDGLIWGASKLQEVAFGVKKLQIGSVLEDEKVSVDLLEEKIQELEEYVQSTDIAAFQKI